MDTVPALPPPGNGQGHASPTPSPHPLDALVDATTAFGSWAELIERLHRGYCPTIRPTTRRKVLLRKAVLAAGFGVWPPARKAVRHA